MIPDTNAPLINFATKAAGQKPRRLTVKASPKKISEKSTGAPAIDLASQTAEIIAPPNFAGTVIPTPYRKKQKEKRANHPDKALIDNCVEFGVHVAGALGAFEVDPTGNNDFAAFHDDLCGTRAAPHLLKATRLKAKSMDGLRAKAQMVAIILKNNSGSVMFEDDDEIAFIKSLVEDVIRFQRAFSEKQQSCEVIPELDR
jgi:hypothetical protein